MSKEKERELLKDFASEWNKKTFQTGQNFINIKDIDSFLAGRPEEKEEKMNPYPEKDRGCRTCKYIDCDGKEPCITCGDGDYEKYEPNNQ